MQARAKNYILLPHGNASIPTLNQSPGRWGGGENWELSYIVDGEVQMRSNLYIP